MNYHQSLQQYLHLCQVMQLPTSFIETVTRIYLPLAQKIFNGKNAAAPLLVSINGAQGTGKSTLTRFVHAILESRYKSKVASFSLDDFYHTRAYRRRLAQEVHPLLLTRGVPGTHDIDLLQSVVDNLIDGNPCRIPVFDKAIDDRKAESQWRRQTQAVDFILFEGWCNNSPPQSEQQLVSPINALEAEEDKNAEWRRYVNQKLMQYHQRVFAKAGLTLFLQAPNFEQVFQWRKLQEDKLRQQHQGDKSTKIMNDDELRRFMQHYERITRHTLDCYAAQADILLPLDSQHRITAILSA